MTEKEEMSERELAINVQILQEQAKILAQNVEMLAMYLQELMTAKATLEGIKEMEKGDEILVPIGASSFIHACIENTQNVIVGIGAAYSTDKTVDQAVENIQQQIALTESRIRENQETYAQVAAKLEELSAEAQTRLEKREYV